MSDQKNKIKTFIVDNYLFGNSDGLKDDASFLEEGIIDSTGVLELITFLEEEFKIEVMDEELIPENLDSIDKVSEFVSNKVNELTTATKN